ncbi:MAG: acetyltransferase [Actinomycetota bacterium]|jgi:hypothetical protein|nr:acetyltransferase [Actinomycetota bacterium]
MSDTSVTTAAPAFAGYAIAELYGHQRIAGFVSEQKIAGVLFLRVDVPDGATHLYHPSAVFGLHPCDQAAAAAAARVIGEPDPVAVWELARAFADHPLAPALAAAQDGGEDDEDDDYGQGGPF